MMKIDVNSITVAFTMLDGAEFIIEDGETLDGTKAWNDFLHGKGFEYEGVMYPFHAIALAVPSAEHSEEEVEDDFCKESGDEPGTCNSLVDEAIVDCSEAA